MVTEDWDLRSEYLPQMRDKIDLHNLLKPSYCRYDFPLFSRTHGRLQIDARAGLPVSRLSNWQGGGSCSSSPVGGQIHRGRLSAAVAVLGYPCVLYLPPIRPLCGEQHVKLGSLACPVLKQQFGQMLVFGACAVPYGSEGLEQFGGLPPEAAECRID